MTRQPIGERVAAQLGKVVDTVQGSQAWASIFRPGSIFRKGYSDSPRNRSYVIMNSVLYHLHPVKVKRHAVKVSYTLCLGGLSFFLFILLTVTGIFLMFFYRPTATQAWDDIRTLQTSVRPSWAAWSANEPSNLPREITLVGQRSMQSWHRVHSSSSTTKNP